MRARATETERCTPLARMNTFDPRPRSLLSSLTIAASATLIVLARAASADPLPPAMQAVLDAHNAYRAKHCVPALTWSTAVGCISAAVGKPLPIRS